MVEKEPYKKLVDKLKKFDFKDSGLKNPYKINDEYDGKHIGPWSEWQGNLEAKILVIGQDWGDVNYFETNKGKDRDDNPTNKNLRELFKEIGIDTGLPNSLIPQPVFLTNAILGIKGEDGKNHMSGKVKKGWVEESTNAFTRELIDIIQPKIIITLGRMPLYAIYSMGLIDSKIFNKKLKELANENPIELNNDQLLFAFSHCGGLGLANRNLDLQKEDWRKIKPFYDKIQQI
jgi:uracil-DNA glycosylase